MTEQKKTSLKKKLFRWIKVIALLYGLIGILVYYLQDYIMFHPKKIASDVPWKFDVPFEETNIPFSDTDTINLVKFLADSNHRKGVVIYYHGNKENIGRYAKFASNFTKHGYEVWMEDYPGFGKSVGDRNERSLNQQAIQLYRLALTKYHADSVILYGKSLGTGIASYVAAVSNAKRLILETPYYDAPGIFSSYLPFYPMQRMIKYKLPTNEYLPEVKYPITIFHGTSDWVIPYRCASRLKAVLKPTDEFITIEGGNHNNINEYEIFQKKMDSLLTQ